MNLTKKELIAFFDEQNKIFDIVRLVDVSLTTAYSISDSGELKAEPYKCYAVWNKNRRCENCISAKAYAIKDKLSKFEFVENEVYFVISAYSIIEGKEFMVEMVSKLNDETLFGAYGKDSFIQSIESYNKKIYIDALTGAYNRNYYDEQLINFNRSSSIAMLDIDNFKKINDTYGHKTGDIILKEITKVMLSHIRTCDAVIRLGGDEFLLVFHEIPNSTFNKRLENIRQAISEIHIREYPELKTTVSIGAVISDGLNDDFFHLADKAMYKAKEHKNCIIYN